MLVTQDPVILLVVDPLEKFSHQCLGGVTRMFIRFVVCFGETLAATHMYVYRRMDKKHCDIFIMG